MHGERTRIVEVRKMILAREDALIVEEVNDVDCLFYFILLRGNEKTHDF